VLVPAQLVAELAQQLLELDAAAVHIADHVERARVLAPVVVLPLVRDGCPLDLVDAVEHVDLAEALAAQAAQSAPQLSRLPPDHVG